MSDTKIPLYDGDDRLDRGILYHDNGDGSYSPTAYVVNPEAIGGGGVSQVEGKDAAGAEPIANPLAIAGVDANTGQIIRAGFDAQVGDGSSAARVSLYGKNEAAGDTPVSVDEGGRTFAAIVDAEGDRPFSVTPSEDGITSFDRMLASPVPYLFNGATFDRQRTPNVFKPFQAESDTPATLNVWTPASGKRFRVMGFVLSLGATAN